MRTIVTYISEKLHLNKDTRVNDDVYTLIKFFKNIDNKESTTKILDAYFESSKIRDFDLYFPNDEQLENFIDDCKKFNIKFDDVLFINADNNDFVEKLEREILDDKITLQNCGEIEKEHIFYTNGEDDEAWFKIYKGQHPEKGIMIECFRYYIILIAK